MEGLKPARNSSVRRDAIVGRRQFLCAGMLGMACAIASGCASSVKSGDSNSAGIPSDASSENSSHVAQQSSTGAQLESQSKTSPSVQGQEVGILIEGETIDRGFVVDEILQVPSLDDIHFSMRVPDAYDGSAAYALYIHVPGGSGWYTQGAGADLESLFVFSAQDYIQDVILISPQMTDWRETSAKMLIALTKWALSTYNIDPNRVYLSGYSFGGSTVSLAVGEHPELYSRVLHMASRWSGSIEGLVRKRLPLKMVIGDADEYYRVSDAENTYRTIREEYESEGLTADEIEELVVLDVKTADYFIGYGSQHGDGADLYAFDPEIIGWLLR